jgi:heme a synthase
MSSRAMSGFRVLSRIAALLAIIVVVVGAWVRLTQAGLGCPDWPGCYGQWHPAQVVDHASEAASLYQRDFNYQKALHEMVHRYIATSLGFLVVLMALWSVKNRRDPNQPRWLPWLILAVIGMQGALGAYTVTLKVMPIIVTLHLLGGLTTLSLLWWQSLHGDHAEPQVPERRLRPLALSVFVMLLIQLFLGGWTSTNYAAIACPDFPTCQHAWLPPADYADGFRLFRGTGIDFEGGILPMVARTAIQLVHRFGAFVLTILILWLWLNTLRFARRAALKRHAWALLLALGLQVVIGINFIWQGYPLSLGTAHNAGAVVLLLTLLSYCRVLWPARRFDARIQMHG